MFFNGMWMGGSDSDPYYKYVELLLKGDGTNGSTVVPDMSRHDRNLKCFGNASISTAAKKYGSGSLVFDGTGDYMTLDNNGNWGLSLANDFTIECYINRGTQVGASSWFFMDFRKSNAALDPLFYLNASNAVVFQVDNIAAIVGPVLTSGQWYHVAATRSNGKIRMFVDGALVGTYQSKTPMTDTFLTLGAPNDRRNATVNFKFTGYLDEIRLTNGFARYIDDFIPPRTHPTRGPVVSSGDPEFAQVTALLHFDRDNLLANSNDWPATIGVTATSPSLAVDGSVAFRLTETAVTSNHGSIHSVARNVGSGETYTAAFDVYGGTRQIQIAATTAADAARIFDYSTGNWASAGTGATFVASGIIDLGLNAQGTQGYRIWITFTTNAAAALAIYGYLYNGGLSYLGNTGNYVIVSRPQLCDGDITNLATYRATKASGSFTGSAPFGWDSSTTYIGTGASLSPSISKFGTGSLNCTTNNGGVQLPNRSEFNLGTDDFTVEFWAYFTGAANGSTATSNTMLFVTADNFNFQRSTAVGSAAIGFWDGSTDRNTGVVPTLNTWYHIAITRVNGTAYIFVNGVMTVSFAFSASRSLASAILGARTATTGYMLGYFDEFRITKGYARYWGNFTPPTAPFPDKRWEIDNTDPYYSITNTLLNGDPANYETGTLIDRSINNLSLTVDGNTVTTGAGGTNGDVRKFLNDTALKFDGTGDHVYIQYVGRTFEPLSTSGTLEFWVNPSVVNVNCGLVDFRSSSSNGGSIEMTSAGKIIFVYTSSTRITSTTTLVANTWYHVCLVYSGIVTLSTNPIFTLYINGKSEGTYAVAVNLLTTIGSITHQLTFGSYYNQLSNTSTGHFNGYIDAIRITPSRRYIGGPFLPDPTRTYPTTGTLTDDPYFESTDVCFTFTGTNGATIFTDYSGTSSTYTTIGNAVLSNNQSKFGGTSLYLDGTGDYVTTTNLVTGTSVNCCLEAWIYPTAVSGATTSGVIDLRASGTSTAPAILYNSSGQVVMQVLNGVRAVGAVSLNAWSHIVVMRYLSNWKLFVNGVQQGADYNSNTSLYLSNANIGTVIDQKNGTATGKFTGYIDSCRWTQGHHRYDPTGFSVPTTPFPTRGTPILNGRVS